MGDNYLGCLVSIDCGDLLGNYQGEVCKIDTSRQTLTLKDVFHNGLKSNVLETTLYAKDITNLSILSTPKDVKIRKIEAGAVSSTRADLSRTQKTNIRDSPRKFVGYVNAVSPNVMVSETPGKSKKSRGKPPGKDEVCFHTNVDMQQEFDFEGNLVC